MEAAATEYPVHLVRRRVLDDGRTVTIRPVRADDEAAERAFFDRLSGEARRLRFMNFVKSPTQPMLHFYTHIDYRRHMAFVCEARVGDEARVVGEARYVANPDGRSCELGIVVADDWHHTGIASLLLKALLRAARANGFETMEGLVLVENAAMLGFAREHGFEVARAPQDPSSLRIVRAL